MTIYLDAVWLLNFLLDWMILLLTQLVTREPSKQLQVMFGAMVASILVPITLFLPDSFVTTPIGKAMYSILIVLCAFGFRNIRKFLKKILTFYFISFALGGGLVGLHFMLGRQITASENGLLTFQTGYGDQVSWLFVFIGFPLVWWFTKVRMDKHALEKFKQEQLYEVTIVLQGESNATTGYMDSGNQLLDPLSQKPVIICDQQFMLKWLSSEELKQLEMAQEQLDFDTIPSKWEHSIQIVPYQGVNGSRTFMIVLKPDRILVNFEDKQISTSKVLIGVQFGELSPDGSYHCLLHPYIFKHSVATSA
ncbi:sigma-E processing peptidase SpoIIGA [Aquibacillus koreensis]|uniref:Sporulation sigma-E factor-processing peptidase n=1 Tax=Aquibacillus koreensis TaxID=279446 RepID=A0A9X3WNP7_9BACI|nr:sigma-E processing peptidase SpoIIGA [Aquibacillus koreensis]MCT2538051.1 sigma-E processing peptidase SpoIIGA [Aquibacillus koreensis]MDC3420574.1 sigma-E processing peptidase SpoIIGA [Aquibacillus koreensis]